ncbi:Blp family class II bacteriocin [Streptococcus pluranimalium]|uniref:Blp family class II bacteriocin n=1 Tax=Streptococcus pluranimalium TaxID=82348 RepID=UPI0039FDB0F3
MNTQTISQFEPLDTDLLAAVEGGKCSWKGAGTATISGAIGGAFTGGFPGAALGAAGGYLGYSATCWW